MPRAFAVGKKAVGFCDQCGFRFKLSKLRKLVVKGKIVNTLVCRSCWVPDQPQLMLGKYPVDDPQALRNPRPDNTYWQAGMTGIQLDTAHIPASDRIAFGTPSGGSRSTQWGWNPVGLVNPLGITGLDNALVMSISITGVEVEIS
jgi:hypothetical protein